MRDIIKTDNFITDGTLLGVEVEGKDDSSYGTDVVDRKTFVISDTVDRVSSTDVEWLVDWSTGTKVANTTLFIVWFNIVTFAATADETVYVCVVVLFSPKNKTLLNKEFEGIDPAVFFVIAILSVK